MPLNILAEFVAMFASGLLADVAGSALGGALKKDRIKELFSAITPEQKQAFLDVVAAAVLHDEVVSDEEEELLGRYRSAAGAAQVQAAFDAAKKADRSVEGYRAFLRARARALGDQETRERALSVASIVLHQGPKERAAEAVRVFGDGLEIPAERVESIYVPG